MRLSNYLTDIDWNYRKTLTALRKLEPLHIISEQNWLSAEREVELCKTQLRNARVMRDKRKEDFRDVHKIFSRLKKNAGEFEEERFVNAEEAEDWRHQ